MRQVHRKEVDFALDPGDLRQCLAKIHLRMSAASPGPNQLRSQCATVRSSLPKPCRSGSPPSGQRPPTSLPVAHGFIESFNAHLRDELLDGEIFYTLRPRSSSRAGAVTTMRFARTPRSATEPRPRGFCARTCRRMAGYATPTSCAGHAPSGATADHQAGADQPSHPDRRATQNGYRFFVRWRPSARNRHATCVKSTRFFNCLQ